MLDEATANIDTVTEQLLEQILRELPPSTTKVIIAHRLNTIENADEIFFINAGEITAPARWITRSSCCCTANGTAEPAFAGQICPHSSQCYTPALSRPSSGSPLEETHVDRPESADPGHDHHIAG